jgi:integrase
MIPMAEHVKADIEGPNPFLAEDTLTLAVVIARIEADETLKVNRRRDICSAARTLARLFNKTPGEVPASPSWLRRRLKYVHPRQAGISQKRFANIKSDLSAGLRHARIPEGRNPHLPKLSVDWQKLWDRLPEGRLRWSLSRFLRFCSGQAIRPEEVDDAAAEAFRQALADECLVKDPDSLLANTVKRWNEAVASVPGWPEAQLTVPYKRQVLSLPLSAFPESFQRDLERYLARLRGDDVFSDDGPAQPLRPSSIESTKSKIRLFASALVHRGHPIERIEGLVYLVDIRTVKDGLRFFLDRSGGRPTPSLHGIATTLKSVARHHVRVDADHLEELRRIAAKLSVPYRGLTQKNRDRLRQFDNPQNIALLVHLPERLLRTARSRPQGDRKAARSAQTAVAIEVLLMCPMRISNLATLALDQNLTWERPGRKGRLHIAVSGAEVKNGEPLEYVLPRESSRLVRDYLEHYRPSLHPECNEYLFPGQNGAHKTKIGLASQISDTIRKETGLVVNPHLFRHLGAKLFLSTHPGGYEVVRRVLGHRSTDTTMGFYTGFESKAAARHYDEVILGHRRASARGTGGRTKTA